MDSLGNVGKSIAASHMERSPAILVSLHDVSSIFHQQRHTLQVPGEHGLMDGCHACEDQSNHRSNIQLRHSPLSECRGRLCCI